MLIFHQNAVKPQKSGFNEGVNTYFMNYVVNGWWDMLHIHSLTTLRLIASLYIFLPPDGRRPSARLLPDLRAQTHKRLIYHPTWLIPPGHPQCLSCLLPSLSSTRPCLALAPCHAHSTLSSLRICFNFASTTHTTPPHSLFLTIVVAERPNVTVL